MNRRAEDKIKVLVLQNNKKWEDIVRDSVRDFCSNPKVCQNISCYLKEISNNFYDIIIIEITLPETNRKQLIEKTKELQEFCSIIYLTECGLSSSCELSIRKLNVEEVFCKDKGKELFEYCVNSVFERRKLMYYDKLSDTLTKVLLESLIENEIKKISRDKLYNFTIVNIDYNNFKKINDTDGHEAGDLIIKRTSNIIRNNIRYTDLFFRVGGDEFYIIFPGIKLDKTIDIMKRINKEIEDDKEIRDITKVEFSLSVGISQGQKEDTCKIVKIKSDLAMYKAKKVGKRIVIRSISNSEDEYIVID